MDRESITGKMGKLFDGEWKNGNMHKGTKVYDKGDRYVGQFNEDDKRHGQGKYYWKSGATFNGEWRNGNMYNGTKFMDNGRQVSYINGKMAPR